MNAEFLFRWLHVFAGIVWLGLLYFFNFVNLPASARMDAGGKKAAAEQMMPRALWWFRWAAMLTLLSGLLLFGLIYMRTPGVGWGPNALFQGGEGLSDRARWIMWGMLFGTIMWFNVWFLIWPAQRRLLKGAHGAEADALRRRAGLASRLNTYLSGPLLIGMLGANHAGMAFSYPRFLILSALALAAIKTAYAHSTFVGKSV
jgi:uncharacterized membrane protein